MQEEDVEAFLKRQLGKSKRKTDVVDRLYKKPTPDKGEEMPHFQHITPNYIHQIDLLYLPNDKGFIYGLVVADQGSRKIDVEPLKERNCPAILKALRTLYKRKILMAPHLVVTDKGREFGKEFTDNLNDIGIEHRTVKAGRHRMVGIVESKNKLIGKLVHKLLLQVQVSSGISSSKWVEFIPLIVRLINKKVEENAEAFTKRQDENKTKPQKKNQQDIKILDVGDKVRVMLENPEDVHGKRLHGKFRASDIRWDPTIREVRCMLTQPDLPIMYLLDGNYGSEKVEPVAYTYNQLQPVSSREKLPTPVFEEDENRHEIAAITNRDLDEEGNVIYLVKWKNLPKNKNTTWEPRSSLVDDLGENYMRRIDKKFNS